MFKCWYGHLSGVLHKQPNFFVYSTSATLPISCPPLFSHQLHLKHSLFSSSLFSRFNCTYSRHMTELSRRCGVRKVSVYLFIYSFISFSFQARTWDHPTSTTLLHCLLWFHSAHSFPIVLLSAPIFHFWGMGEVCSWHTSAPPTVYICFTQNPVHSLKVQSINTVWCWNTALRLLAACLRSDLLHLGYCFHSSYYLWFARILHTCFIPLFNMEEYRIADRNNTKWLPCLLLHWYYLNWQILSAKSNWVVITALVRPGKNDEQYMH